MREVPLVMPKMSMTMTEGTFLTWLKKEGDVIRNGDIVCEVASDKVDIEVESPIDGTLGRLVAKSEDVIQVGAPLAFISTESDDLLDGIFDSAPTVASPVAAADPAPTPPRATPPSRRGPQPAVPFARRRASELKINLREVIGSGPGGLVTLADVELAAENRAPAPAPAPAATPAPPAVTVTPSAPPAAPVPASSPPAVPGTPSADTDPFGPVEVVALSRIARVAGRALTTSWTTIPHVTHHDDADITDLDVYRREVDQETADCRITLLAFVIAASARALRTYPAVNSSLTLDEKSITLKRYCHVGVAVDTEGGLVVPVIRDADRKGIVEISHDLADISTRAREHALTGEDLSGASFTISSLGGIGGTAFTPIVNRPQVAILGVSRSVVAPVWNGEEFRPRLQLPLSLSYDHRVVDGALGARFTARIAHLLGDVRRLLL